MNKTKKILLFVMALFVSLIINAQSSNYFTHTVKKGQTLYSISRMYNTTVEELIKLNPGSASRISVGQELKIPQTQQASTDRNDSNSTTDRYHTIQAGETLYRLGQTYGITPREICDANPGLSINTFRAGEVIRIPAPKQETAVTPANTNNKPEEVAATKTHKVKRNESIDDICAIYGITREEIIEANPILRQSVLKRDMILVIPEHKEENVAVQPREESNTELFTQYSSYRDSINSTSRARVNGATRVGVVLSFLLDSYAPSEQGKIIEYYQGLLISVDELKRLGHSFEINTFDAGKKESSLDSLIASGSLDDMDIIIGATYSNHNKELAEFAKKKEIPLVIPFANKEDEIYRNPMVYIVNSQQSYIIPEVTSQFVRSFPNANVIFVEDSNESSKTEFVSALTEELDKHGMPYTRVSIESFTAENKAIPTLNELRVKDKDNFLIPTSASAKTLNSLLPVLVQAKRIDSTSVSGYKMFGYPEWQIHAANTRDQMYEIETYFYASFYSHYSIPEVTAFQNKFVRWYSRNIQNIYPRFAMLGYDTGYYFLLAASTYGKDMAENINDIEFTPIQTGFNFERVNNWGGMVNKKFYFIHYRPDFLIEKINFEK